jgi:hypothetical protein
MSNSNKIPFFVKVNSFDENKQKVEDKPSAEQPLGKREDGPNEKKKKIKELFVQHLTGEMYSAILNLILMPHIILKVFLVVFLLVSFGLASYTVITLVLSYFEYGVPRINSCKIILLSLIKMHVLTRSCKTVVLARSSKSILQELTRSCKTHHMQDRARGSCKYLQD